MTVPPWAAQAMGELLHGRVAWVEPPGHSMDPLVKNRERVLLEPVDLDDVKPGDIVLCKVKGSTYLHHVKAKRDDGPLLIGNARGHTNGWTRHVYGRLVRQ